MARLFPSSPHPHLIPDVPNRACPECVVDCDDDACTAKIDDQCTEQCRGVIVPCDDPEHGDIQCPEGKCESSACDIPDNCSLVSTFHEISLTTSDVTFQLGHDLATCETLQHTGTSCAQDGYGLTCGGPTCDDPDNCSFVDIVSAEYPKAPLSFETKAKEIPPQSSGIAAEHTYAPHTHARDWDATLDAFLCSCGVGTPPHDGTTSYHFPTLSTLASPSETCALPSTFTAPLPHPPCTPPLYLAQPPAPVVLPGHTCLWNGCHSTFSSLDELISHVNISHLRAHSSQLPEPVASLSPYLRLSSEPLGLPCRWDNCHASVNSSSDQALDDALNSLTGHLLHDHLGLHDEPEGGHNTTTTHPTTSLADVILPIPPPDRRQDVEMRDEEQPSDNKQQIIPWGGNAKQDEANEKTDEQPRSTTAEDQAPPIEMGASRRCCWRGCERSFSAVDDLMNHLTAEHVGSGKNHYECFWRDCERNGEKGFTSKQKVCRHLQVRDSPASLYNSIVLYDGGTVPVDAHGSQTIPVQALRATFLRGSNAATTHATSHTRKFVTPISHGPTDY